MKTPIFHAIAAECYISLVATFFFYAPMYLGESEDTVFAPMAMLSLLVLSVAIMGYLFFYTPLALFIAGKREEGIQFFGKTILFFALITSFVFSILFLTAR